MFDPKLIIMQIILTTKEELKELFKDVLKEFKSDAKQELSDDPLIDKKEAAKILGVSVPTIDNYRRNGNIPSYRIGASVRFKKSEVIKAMTK